MPDRPSRPVWPPPRRTRTVRGARRGKRPGRPTPKADPETLGIARVERYLDTSVPDLPSFVCRSLAPAAILSFVLRTTVDTPARLDGSTAPHLTPPAHGNAAGRARDGSSMRTSRPDPSTSTEILKISWSRSLMCDSRRSRASCRVISEYAGALPESIRG